MTLDISRLVTVSLLLAAGACGRSAAIQPHDMSVAQHEVAADDEDRQAADTTNPIAADKGTAEQHRVLAAQHRAASLALQDAEGRACTGLSAEDRDLSPFAHPADISGVSLLREKTPAGRFMTTRDGGATIVFRARPGLTAEWMQRVIDCHLARNAAVGHDLPEMSYCPLVPRGAEATVRSVGDEFAVEVRAGDRTAAAEIWRRAQRLTTVR